MKEGITSTESASRSSYETMEANARPRVVCRGAAFRARPTRESKPVPRAPLYSLCAILVVTSCA